MDAGGACYAYIYGDFSWTMRSKRNLLVTSVIIMIVFASMGFFETGHNQGEDMEYQNSNGTNTILIQWFTQIEMRAIRQLQRTLCHSQPTTYWYSFVPAGP